MFFFISVLLRLRIYTCRFFLMLGLFGFVVIVLFCFSSLTFFLFYFAVGFIVLSSSSFVARRKFSVLLLRFYV